MAGLKEIRDRLSSVGATVQLTSAMKMVSASKLRKAQTNHIRLRGYMQEMGVIFGAVMEAKEENEMMKLFIEGTGGSPKKVLIIVFTSNKGLCGSFNSHVCKMVEERLNTKYAHLEIGTEVQLLCFGSKGADYFAKKGYVLYENPYGANTEQMGYEEVSHLAYKIVGEYYLSEFDRVEVVYHHPVNAAVQNLRTIQILPTEGFFRKVIATGHEPQKPTHYILQPSRAEILKDLLPILFSVGIYFLLESSRVSEHGARMTAMSKASENADALIHVLNRQYNRLRQSAITNELLEIVSGANALR